MIEIEIELSDTDSGDVDGYELAAEAAATRELPPLLCVSTWTDHPDPAVPDRAVLVFDVDPTPVQRTKLAAVVARHKGAREPIPTKPADVRAYIAAAALALGTAAAALGSGAADAVAGLLP